MNNLNNPPHWNIHPNDEGGDGNKWNYALLVPMLGLAAFRWIWSKESEKEIRRAELEYKEKATAMQTELENKYQDIILEKRRAAAKLEVALEKEHNRAEGYRTALISQSQKLVQERKVLEQEREQFKQEVAAAHRSGVASAVYASYLKKEDDWQRQARGLLKEFEEALKERQNIFCSLVEPRKKRLEIEKDLLVKAATNTIAAELQVTDGLLDIFKHDTHCAAFLNTNKHKNGKIMWLYLKYWELLVDLKKFKRVEGVMMGN
ncbi:coiled-coil domain-containing protein 127 [Gastrophryne carolinensis]